jgi:hypothetical protein
VCTANGCKCDPCTNGACLVWCVGKGYSDGQCTNGAAGACLCL